MNEPNPLPFVEAFALADCAARIVSEHRPTPADTHRRSTIILREPAVRGLRYLWKTGDDSQRMTVACRVHVWLHGKADRGRTAVQRQQFKKQTAAA